ncbi:MAG TPA: glycosyltransferase family 2 protein [Roseiflexaceae bacterium]|nr:glycosyltransferase family 2 protein [Roseiflexaceae bacterium]
MIEQSRRILSSEPERKTVQRTINLSPFQPELSMVVPTRNEAGNIATLIERLEEALPRVALEIIFVDDSDDETVAAIELAGEVSRCGVRLLHRAPGQRTDGLGGAVVAGLRMAQAPWVCVMDADLQHPPELVPELFEKAQQSNSDLVVASRYCATGAARGLNARRTVISRGSTVAAQVLFPQRLHGVTDPMSGFFLVRKDAIDIDKLRPRGFKILLEIMVKSSGLRISEVGFEFGERYAGESKASFREGMRYFSHLCQLRFGENILQFARFLAVGLSGLLVNSLVLWMATELLGLHYLVSVVLATEGSTLWNFILSEIWVFSTEGQKQGRFARLLLFFLMNNAALGLRGPMVYVLTSVLGVYYLISNLLSLVAMTALRYAVADKFIWGRSSARKSITMLHSYNVHDIITVVSEVGLPELERFRVESLDSQPTIRVRMGMVNPAASQNTQPADSDVRRIYYNEGLGPVGFAINVTLGEMIDVVASPILRYSPHVLYTNVVEPILRWTFVEKGYALVHGACISFGNKAYMITARTDTGKTTTILRLLDRQRRATDTAAFLSDDLTLVAPDGRVMTYPKPMTISHHTVAAINTPRLSFGERLTLPLQSRLHSREGRKFAFWLTQSKLPVATINTITQLVVPPPKYHVQKLVPHARVTREARLAGLIVIERVERGADADVQLSEREGLDILLSNCEDAYGFPPYDTIKTVLHNTNKLDLRSVERGIIEQSLKGLPATLLRSSKMDWSSRIPALVQGTEPRGQWTELERSVGGEMAIELGAA